MNKQAYLEGYLQKTSSDEEKSEDKQKENTILDKLRHGGGIGAGIIAGGAMGANIGNYIQDKNIPPAKSPWEEFKRSSMPRDKSTLTLALKLLGAVHGGYIGHMVSSEYNDIRRNLRGGKVSV